MAKKKKEKPTYSVWQNSTYVIKEAWERDKSVILVIIVQMLIAVAISVAGIFLPATVVAQITNDIELSYLIFTVLGFAVVLVLLNGVQGHLENSTQIRRTGLRLHIVRSILKKTLHTDYANLGNKAFTDAKEQAQEQSSGNNTSTEQIYNTFTRLGTNILGFIVYIIILATINPLILLITATTAILGAIARQWANKWRHQNIDELTSPGKRTWYISNIGSDESLAKDIRLFSMGGWLKDIFDANMRLSFNFERKSNGKRLIADLVDIFATFLREGIAYAYLIWLVLQGQLAVEGFVLMFAAVGGFSTWISGILNEFTELLMHSLNYCRVRSFFEYPDHFKRDAGEMVPATDSFSLEMRNVSFKYNGTETNVLEDINLTITPGEKLAIVGLNGAGKTTLVKLLCGLYDPTEGAVLLNGKDIRDFNRQAYYELFTAVFQEFNILPVSIAENISQQYDDLIDSERVANCLEMAGIADKVNRLPEGANSLLIKDVNPEAVELSGGETQRVMLARALYKDAPILVLDEPTAALDPIAESELYNRYNDLSYGRTSLYISHRLASTRFCDRIILVADKGIAEMGTHDELIKQDGIYAELFEIQSKYYQEGSIAS